MIEILFSRYYYQGADFGVLPEGHVRVELGGASAGPGEGPDPWPSLAGALGEVRGAPPRAGTGPDADLPLPERILEAARAVAAAIGEPLGRGAVHRRPGDAVVDLRLQAADSMVAARALQLAVMAANQRFDPAEVHPDAAPEPFAERLSRALAELAAVAGTRRADATMQALIAAADAERIPHIRFDRWPFLSSEQECPPAARRLLQLGEGRHLHLLHGTLPGRTPRASLERVGDHWSCWSHLRQAGLPVPARDPELTNTITFSRAQRVARGLGYPLVVKPRTPSRGVGVTCGIGDEAALREAVASAQAVTRQVVLERHVPGTPWRILVIDGAVVAACPRGESGRDRAAELHPDLRAMAVTALAGLELTIAAVDLVTADPSRGPDSGDTVFLGIEPAPDLAPFCLPGEDIPRTAARRLVRALFPPGAPATVPKVAITGTDGKTTTAHMVADILRRAGRSVGLASTSGRFRNGELVVAREASGARGALDALRDPGVDVAVLETARGELVHKGLACHAAEVAACTNIADDHIGFDGIETLDQMAVHKRQVVEKATACAVLNADDPRCLGMAPHLRARRIALFSLHGDAETIRGHVAAGGLAAVVRHDGGVAVMTLLDADRVLPLIPVRDLPASWGGRAAHNVENALCAAALAYGAGVGPEAIAAALRELDTTPEVIPGRLNRVEGLPFQVLVDAAHNAHGLRALARLLDDAPSGSGARRLVFFARPDQTTADIDAMAAEVASAFDSFVCRDSIGMHGAEAGSCARALASALERAGVASARVQVIPDREAAMRHALDAADPGDLLVFCTVWPGPTLEYLAQEVAAREEESRRQEAR